MLPEWVAECFRNQWPDVTGIGCRMLPEYPLAGLAVIEQELLMVLDNPVLPLHNNLSESQIREHVKRRKISGSTKSEGGQRSRVTFASLKKTCRQADSIGFHSGTI